MIEGLIIAFELFLLFILLVKVKKNIDRNSNDLGVFAFKE